MGNKETSIDEMFKKANLLSQKMHEYMGSHGFDEKFATAMINATDPDSKFKADMAVKISTVMNLLDMFLQYLH